MKKDVIAKISTFLFLLVVSVLLIFLNSLDYLNSSKNLIFYSLDPLQNVFQGASNRADNFLYAINKINRFQTENIELKKENFKLSYKISQFEEKERENESLRKQIEFSDGLCSEGTCIKWKAGGIIGRDPENYGKYIIINLGDKQKIKKNQAVTSPGGVLIGKTTEVFENHSKVMLIISPGSSINSIVKTTRANGIVVGKYATGAKLEMINQNEDLIDGDIIITSGLEDGVPKGLLVGKISNIEELANNVFKQADVNLFADFNHLEEVFIAEQQ